MAFLIAAAGWFFFLTIAGLITGTPALRTFGAAGVCVFVLWAFLLDRYSKPADSWESHLVDGDFNHIEFVFPEREDAA